MLHRLHGIRILLQRQLELRDGVRIPPRKNVQGPQQHVRLQRGQRVRIRGLGLLLLKMMLGLVTVVRGRDVGKGSFENGGSFDDGTDIGHGSTFLDAEGGFPRGSDGADETHGGGGFGVLDLAAWMAMEGWRFRGVVWRFCRCRRGMFGIVAWIRREKSNGSFRESAFGRSGFPPPSFFSAGLVLHGNRNVHLFASLPKQKLLLMMKMNPPRRLAIIVDGTSRPFRGHGAIPE
mmetsp:Transcript_19145/g.40228  ORF Transcript_19145/g.40228 Transcript_19145/m.40228 type:complete len:233 (-) Transcript_19145:460-1158(-)